TAARENSCCMRPTFPGRVSLAIYLSPIDSKYVSLALCFFDSNINCNNNSDVATCAPALLLIDRSSSVELMDQRRGRDILARCEPFYCPAGIQELPALLVLAPLSLRGLFTLHRHLRPERDCFRSTKKLFETALPISTIPELQVIPGSDQC